MAEACRTTVVSLPQDGIEKALTAAANNALRRPERSEPSKARSSILLPLSLLTLSLAIAGAATLKYTAVGDYLKTALSKLHVDLKSAIEGARRRS